MGGGDSSKSLYRRVVVLAEGHKVVSKAHSKSTLSGAGLAHGLLDS